jgi:cysteine desulfurase family protein (TIGR01976 family)
VVNAVADYLYNTNANIHGVFATSLESDALTLEAREVLADFLGCLPEEVAFGENSSSNNFKLSYAFARSLSAGDEVIVTDIDHEGNRSPWRYLEDFGVVVKSVRINTDDISLDFDDYMSKLSDRTKLVAVNWAANSCGSITDVKRVIAEAHGVGAITVVDAVHYAPHKPIDVKEIDTDILVCSAYKFFGPHIGILYCKKSVGENLKSIRVIADDNTGMPYKFETGTVAMEMVSGAREAVEFIADIGRRHMKYFGENSGGGSERRAAVLAGMAAIDAYEEYLADRLRGALSGMDGVTVYGPADPGRRTSTVSFSVDGVNANEIASFMADRGIFVWDGDFYAIATIVDTLHMDGRGGLLRVGFAPYNVMSDVERVIDAVNDIVSKRG